MLRVRAKKRKRERCNLSDNGGLKYNLDGIGHEDVILSHTYP